MSSYEAVLANGVIDEKTNANTLMYVAMSDIGPCNIRIAVAIKAINDYLQTNSSDPLGLRPFVEDTSPRSITSSPCSQTQSAVFTAGRICS